MRWDALAKAAQRIDLGAYLMLGRGEELSGGRSRPSNLAGALEALIGAAFLDGGMTLAKKLVLKLLKPDLEEIAAQGITADSKSRAPARRADALAPDPGVQAGFVGGAGPREAVHGRGAGRGAGDGPGTGTEQEAGGTERSPAGTRDTSRQPTIA